MIRFLQAGHGEELKGAVHAAAVGLCAVMCAYNGCALVYRAFYGEQGTPQERLAANRHLALNTLVYALAAAWEVRQAGKHNERVAGPVKRRAG